MANNAPAEAKRHVSFSAADDKEKKDAEGKKPLIPKGPSASWQVPRSQYEVKQIIGTGSYGSVCEAMDHTRKKLVAIKKIAHMFEDLIDCKRILREIAILAKLKHDHIVEIYDIVAPSNMKTFDELYIVMEICDSD
eukprot:CAMPEP_0179367014 /NCGR_PEP_ID=MMETSP0797-20121207/83354_1 /TAXON_ID=47934 /ORGANISM="Dinophysis acuminata, Strain DAEP01" /LENGTH=135 /DNA_ID=CAMNT_0021082547 /DNA_START=55 /DNA_END=459 /DNA_ORIENTATION=+